MSYHENRIGIDPTFPLEQKPPVEPRLFNERQLWISPDIQVLDGIELRPGESADVRIQLTPESLPLGQMPLELIRNLRTSPRSRYGQVFVEIEEAGESVYAHLLENGINTLEGVDKTLLQPTVRLRNDALRNNIIKSGGGVLRFVWPGGKHLVGDELLSSPLRMNGKPISDGMVRKNRQGTAVALRFTLDPDTRRFIPPGGRPIEIDPFNGHQRGQIKLLERPVPTTDRIIPYIVFSKEELEMPEGFYGIVRSCGYSKVNGNETHRSISAHGTSQFFDPNRTWRMLFELRGRTTPQEVANFIDVDVFSNSY